MVSDTDSDVNADGPSRAVSAWTTGLVCVSIVACGVIAGGLLHEPEPELTTTPPTTTAPPEPVEHTYVTPSVTYPTQIPGCVTVDPPTEGGLFGWAAVDEFGYDNPAFPWFSGPKAVAMSAAVHDALPEGVVLDFAPIDDSLFFQPILGDETTEFDPFTNARASLRRGEHAGSLSVSVRPSDDPIPPCVAGQLDERRHLADTTVVDTEDSWSETDGVRTFSRSATAYLPDGSMVIASATDAPDGSEPTGTVPLTIDELVQLVTVPGVRVTAAVPPGTPQPPESCSVSVMGERTPQIDEATARRLDAVLSAIPMEGLVLDRPLGQLLPGGSATGGLCQTVRVTAGGQPTRLRVSIATEQPLPAETARPSYGDRMVSDRRLPDGSVVEIRESHFGSSSGTGPVTQHMSRTVTVTRPSGTEIQVISTADSPTEPLPVAQLEAIALAPGLEVRR
ncbi:hypothetical protein GV794_23850 [Nocardia cyriacigeorgica]|uniref:Uncharacterized protein n=1 Tax=Nocardia cyriacigeorgica TaxID=135487 RepID=A0A6P1D4I4_9NOCA|nr:hypothetical protein [Nocardia cyriacigeorgica]NEW39788.1 hypothetical protein [Nocardia cyriacigeorgica]NEW45515.1 hypothetical protein [Nocardia cyriacigeorgica]NEW58655.1 hypothetical protein [Nocardia cyriacigeorgica]